MASDREQILAAFAAPFDRRDVKSKPQAVSGNRAMAIFYLDARAVQDRLDAVVGVAGWKDDYECLADGSVICRLSVRIGDEWITKVDVGGQSEQPDGGDRIKAAFSDALKRTAVKYGIGRYLYRLPQQWCDYDPVKKRFLKPPGLPDWALPAKSGEQRAESQQGKKAEARPALAAELTPMLAQGPLTPAPQVAPPQTGVELQERLYAQDKKMAANGKIKPGELVQYVRDEGIYGGFPDEIGRWEKWQVEAGCDCARDFCARKQTGRITYREEAKLKQEIDRRHVDEDAILEECGIGDLGHMTDDRLADVMSRLQQTKLKVQREQEEALAR